MTVPGFDALVPERIRLPADDKKGKVVAPRAARRALPALPTSKDAE